MITDSFIFENDLKQELYGPRPSTLGGWFRLIKEEMGRIMIDEALSRSEKGVILLDSTVPAQAVYPSRALSNSLI